MLRFLADENFNNAIVRGLLRREPTIDIVRAQDTELVGADDPNLLAWAAQQERIILTHDVRTMTNYAYERTRSGQRMPGVFEIGRAAHIGQVIDGLLLIAERSDDREWEGQVRYLPLR
ncbi:MAG: DUF5615 family PIN-like protein [Thermomicrobiales bacterium]